MACAAKTEHGLIANLQCHEDLILAAKGELMNKKSTQLATIDDLNLQTVRGGSPQPQPWHNGLQSTSPQTVSPEVTLGNPWGPNPQ
jgi:hypothetical protein